MGAAAPGSFLATHDRPDTEKSARRPVTFSAPASIKRQIGSGALEPDADIRKTALGDHSAFGRIVEAYQGRIFAYLGRMGLDSTTAEDIAQDTFLRVWRSSSQFNPKLGGLTTWILTIARNLALTHLSLPVRGFELGGVEEAADAASDLPQPDEQLVAKQRRERLRVALSCLSPADRSLLAASYIDDLDLATIARIEGCSISAAKVRLHRARTRLRQILEADDGR
jgi:RNA polymerase sigma-70 factor, ECF subfamily